MHIHHQTTNELWSGKRVFTTGHTVFKGGWLSLWLTSLGAEVTGYSLDKPSEPCLFEFADIENCKQSISGDIRNIGECKISIAKAKPDHVMHLAA